MIPPVSPPQCPCKGCGTSNVTDGLVRDGFSVSSDDRMGRFWWWNDGAIFNILELCGNMLQTILIEMDIIRLKSWLIVILCKKGDDWSRTEYTNTWTPLWCSYVVYKHWSQHIFWNTCLLLDSSWICLWVPIFRTTVPMWIERIERQGYPNGLLSPICCLYPFFPTILLVNQWLLAVSQPVWWLSRLFIGRYSPAIFPVKSELPKKRGSRRIRTKLVQHNYKPHDVLVGHRDVKINPILQVWI